MKFEYDLIECKIGKSRISTERKTKDEIKIYESQMKWNGSFNLDKNSLFAFFVLFVMA